MRIIADPQKQLDEGRERRNRAMQRARGAKAAGKPYADMVRFARLCNHILCTYRASLAGRRFLRPAGVKVALRQERQLARRLPAPGTSPSCRTPLTRQARFGFGILRVAGNTAGTMKLVTTTDGVMALTKQILNANEAAEGGSTTYLQSLVLRTQKELGASPRTRSGRKVTLDPEGIKVQLAALATANDEFYAAVVQAASENLPGTSAKAKELNRRTNFARTALSAVRKWIRSGRDVGALAADRVTKSNIAVALPPREMTPKSLARRVARGVTELIDHVTALAAQDKAAAVNQLQHALTLVTNSLAALGTSATRDPAKALAESIPLRTRQGIFVPVHNGGQARVAA